MSDISTAPAGGKSRLPMVDDLNALERYLDAEQDKADAATCVEDLIRSASTVHVAVTYA